MKTISYSHNRYGYEVLVWRNGRCIGEYHAGNHKLDSSERTDDPRWMIPLDQIREYAARSARDLAAEHRIPASQIEDEGYIEEATQ